MKNATRRGALAAVAAAVVALLPLAGVSAANAAESDISVVYSTQNNAAAPTDGSYTVHGRVGQVRDDMRLSYTIQSANVAYPIPVINYTGTLVDTADATYTFRFDCDSTVAGSDCAGYQYAIDQLNAAVQTLDGNSIATFVADVTPIIMQFGGAVPPGVRGTVTASVLSDVPGTGQLEFWLQEGQSAGAERLSPTVVTPLSITEPELSGTYRPTEFCVAGLTERVEGDLRYTPTGYGRDAVEIIASVADAGILPDDATPVGTAGAFAYALDAGAPVATVDEITAQLLAAPVGAHDVIVDYLAPDGVPAVPVYGTVNVLGTDDSRCWSTSPVVKPVDPQPQTPAQPQTPVAQSGSPKALAQTGAESTPMLPAAGAGIALLGALLLGAAALRRRITA